MSDAACSGMGGNMEDRELYGMLDISCVRQIHTEEEIKKICRVALDNHLAAVFVMPWAIPLTVRLLSGQQSVRPASVVGFPSGAESTSVKVYQAEELLRQGCREFDMVMNLSWLREGRYKEIMEEIRQVKRAVEPYSLKVIIEAPLLTDGEIMRAGRTAAEAGADYVKTATGWTGGCDCRMVSLIARAIRGYDHVRIKAAGGIDSRRMMEEMYDLGCTRFGIGVGTWERIFMKKMQV